MEDGPRIVPIEPGVVRVQTLMGAERSAAYWGFACAVILFVVALYGQWAALKGLWLCGLWHALCVLMYRRDPQFWSILWDKEYRYPWPMKLAPAPEVRAPLVPLEASVPVRAEGGAYGE